MDLKNIFFSYSRADASDFALKLAVDLQEKGFNVWIDQQDIRAGSEWDLEIEKALETCDCLLFIESEKSVTSNNVLDEVYCAMDAHKVVIPVIYKDSKTPFRIKRLQHIDFTTSYETGLAHLARELKSSPIAGSTQPDNQTEVKISAKPFFTKPGVILIIALAIIIAAVGFIYLINNKKELNKTPGQIIQSNDTPIDQDSSKIEAIVNGKKASPEIQKINEKKATVRRSDKNEIKKPVDEIVNLHETFEGKWQLTGVEPIAKSYSGYLNIEEIDEKKVKILSSFQFYFFKTNDTAFFSVFNGIANCSSCVLQKEMTITDNDVAFATQSYKILKKAQTGIGNVGDTIENAGSNTSIRASVTLHLINKSTAIIKVQKAVSTPISRGFTVAPFIYTFRFTKREY
ncbi:MAG: toll/interleukin-1 receptor domain-containing protein [Ferruginibacter sp.]